MSGHFKSVRLLKYEHSLVSKQLVCDKIIKHKVLYGKIFFIEKREKKISTKEEEKTT
jgi:hypothetical protein